MFHLTWAGMLGRKKESSLLLIVLVLSFLLSSALAIVLPSTQAGIQLQRQKTYGSWQLMLYGESDNVCDTMAQAAQARGAKSAFLPTVGVTSEDEIISEITPELMELSGFELLEGRLPENKDEILIVENQFGIRSKPQVGEQISVQYFWDIYSTDADDYRRRQDSAAEISQLLSVPRGEIAPAVRRVLDEQARLKERLAETSREMVTARAAAQSFTDGNICVFDSTLDDIALRELVNLLMEKCTGFAAAFSGSDAAGYKYIIGSRHIDLRKAARDINAAIGGRGGGRPEMIQGSTSETKEIIQKFVENVHV